jgi:WD40 repeat protein
LRNPIQKAAFSPDGKRVRALDFLHTGQLWEAETGSEIELAKTGELHINRPDFSTDGKRVLAICDDHTARIWDAQNGTEIAVLKAHEGWLRSAAFSPDGKRVVTASADHSARIWETGRGMAIATFKGHHTDVSSATFSPDGKRVMTASTCDAAIWDAETMTQVTVLKPPELDYWNLREKGPPVKLSAAFGPDGKQIVTWSSHDETARVWDIITGTEVSALEANEPFKSRARFLEKAMFSVDGKRLLTRSRDNTVRIWDVQTGTEIAILKGHQTDASKQTDLLSTVFSPDGTQVVTTSPRDKTARIWDVERMIERAVLKVREPEAWRLRSERDGPGLFNAAFSPDGRLVVTALSDDTLVQIWDIERGGQIVATMNGPQIFAQSVVFSPDGTRLLISCKDKTLRIWATHSGAEIAILETPELPRTAVFSPDGRRVLTTSYIDQTVQIWDAALGSKLALLKADGFLTSAAFSPDGKRVLTACSDAGAQFWDVSRTEIMVYERSLVLTAALSCGVGSLPTTERQDLLMKDAPEDLFAEAMAQLGDRYHAVADIVTRLHAPWCN